MKRILPIALLLAAIMAPPRAIALGADPALGGMYAAEGLNPDGSKYRGVVKIDRHGESYLLAWMYGQIEDGTLVLVPRAAGIGVASGGVLAVSYYAQGMTGVILYQIEDRGQRLVGGWVMAGADGTIHTETLTKLTMPATGPESETSSPPTPMTPRAVLRGVVASR